MMRLTSDTPDALGASTSSRTDSSIALSSRGGPGSSSTACCPASSQRPGAVPLALSMTRAPAGTIACRRLMAGISMRRDSNRALILAVIRSSSDSGRSSTPATTSRVRSSSVGPSPPQQTTRSALLSANRSAEAISSRSSPTWLLQTTSIPRRLSCSVMNSEFVSRREGVSSSLPTAMIAARLRPAIPVSPKSGRASRRCHKSPPSRHRPSPQARPGRRSNRADGHGLKTSSTRNTRKPTIAPVRLTGRNASVISMPTTSSMTTGAGSMPPK